MDSRQRMNLTSQSSAGVLPVNREGHNQSYKDLLVWQKAMDLVVLVYELADQFPNAETYGLTSQIRRAVVSVPSNIAEGQARGATNSEFGRFVRIALGSLAELDTQVELAVRLGYATKVETESIFALALELRKMLFGLLKKLR